STASSLSSRTALMARIAASPRLTMARRRRGREAEGTRQACPTRAAGNDMYASAGRETRQMAGWWGTTGGYGTPLRARRVVPGGRGAIVTVAGNACLGVYAPDADALAA